MVATIQLENAMRAIPLDALLGDTDALETYQCTVTKAGFGLRMNPAITVVILQLESVQRIPDLDVLLATTNVPAITP